METTDNEKIRRKGAILTNLSYLMADVANTYCMSAESANAKIGMQIRHEEKRKFALMSEAARALKQRTKEVTRQFYKCADATCGCEDSDWFADLILLIVDRCGEDPELMAKVRTYVEGMPSKVKIYK